MRVVLVKDRILGADPHGIWGVGMRASGVAAPTGFYERVSPESDARMRGNAGPGRG
jgi:hypothetical protein